MSKFTSYLMASCWAMSKEHATAFKETVDGFNETKIDAEVLEAYSSRSAMNTERARVRDGVGILYVEGPLFKKANMMVEFCGATSYAILARDFQALIDDPAINAIALYGDSPGGEANGCDELANLIYASRGIKPITAFVSGMACSGCYWIMSAADRMVVSDGAILGSIGVVLGVEDRTEAEAKRGVKTVEFVSSQSPGKRPKASTEAGAARIQTMVDDLADVFISSVARNRGVSTETVIEKFGAGGVEVGKKAVALGMADEVGSFESVLASLKASGDKGRNPTRLGGFTMSEQNTGLSAEEVAAKATATAQSRMKSILTADAGKALPTLASHLAYDTSISSDDAVKILVAAKGDLDTKAAEAPAPIPTPEPQAPAASYSEHKQGSGAILGAPEGTARTDESDKIAAGWGNAVKDANASLGV